MQISKGSGITVHGWIKEGDLANLMEAISKGEQYSVHKHGGAGRCHFLPTLSTLALTPQGKAFAFAGPRPMGKVLPPARGSEALPSLAWSCRYQQQTFTL